MRLLIDNRNLTGPADFTDFVEADHPPKIKRRLNLPSVASVSLIGEAASLVGLCTGSKVWIEREDGSRWFTWTIEDAPQQELVGRGMRSSVVRITFEAKSDEVLLDRVPLTTGITTARGDAAQLLRRWTDSAGAFDTSGVEDVGDVTALGIGSGERWSSATRRLASACRASYAAENGEITLRSIGTKRHELRESDPTFIPEGLSLEQKGRTVSDWTVVGEIGPGRYVKDYFVGDGHTLRFPMSAQPFLRPSVDWLDEEYAGDLSPMKWNVVNASSISAGNGKLMLSGGTGRDSETVLSAVEPLELGGCVVLEHGALVLSSASEGLIGGLYNGAIATANCLAGFSLSSSAGNTTVQSVINGAASGTSMPIIYGHRYELTTRMYSTEGFRAGQSYRWSEGIESANSNAADVRFVMEARDLDAGTPIAAATVLYEGVVTDAPMLATYAVVNAINVNGSIAYTRVRRMPSAEVRTTSAANGATRARIVGLISEGAECIVTTGPAVYFYAPYKPANGDQIVVRYRAAERVAARVVAASSDASASAEIVRVNFPLARTDEDCRIAAIALIRDSAAARFRGSYATWTDLIATGEVRPGDLLTVDAESRGVQFTAVVREVESEIVDGVNDRAKCLLKFAEDGAEPMGMELAPFAESLGHSVQVSAIGQQNPVAAIGRAEVTEILSLSVTIDVGMEVPQGGGIEARREADVGWGEGNDRNLIARFATRTITVPRSTRSEDYYLRMYDASVPRNYSPVTTLLHVDVKDESI